jgi:hypothetical protein
MVNITESTKYNVTQMNVDSLSDLLVQSNQFMQGGLAYGIIFVLWLVSMTLYSNYPNIDALKASTFTAWLASIVFAVFGVVPASFPAILAIIVAALSAFQSGQP